MPFAETREQIGGYDIVECADLAEALEPATKDQVARFGSIEARPFWESWRILRAPSVRGSSDLSGVWWSDHVPAGGCCLSQQSQAGTVGIVAGAEPVPLGNRPVTRGVGHV
jgi:hypothetical protein